MGLKKKEKKAGLEVGRALTKKGGNWGYGGNFDPGSSIIYGVPILRIGTLQAQGRTVA